MRLTEMKPGQVAIVRTVDAARDTRGRLMDLGIIPGSEVQLVRHLPLSQGLQVMVRRARLVLRNNLAEQIDVQVAA